MERLEEIKETSILKRNYICKVVRGIILIIKLMNTSKLKETESVG